MRPSNRSRDADAQCDHVVGTLLGRPGIDVILLDRLPEPDDDVTERMAIESMGGDAAVVAWGDPDQIVDQFGRLGQVFIRTQHRRDVNGDQSPAPGTRQLYCFDMRRIGASETILGDLQRLLQVRQTPTFSIGLGGTIPATSRRTAPQSIEPTPTPPESLVQQAGTELDDLVDELDRLDL
ncbi:MAG: hypothetical protein AAGC97_07195 [Planctomycetota bacterium]